MLSCCCYTGKVLPYYLGLIGREIKRGFEVPHSYTAKARLVIAFH